MVAIAYAHQHVRCCSPVGKERAAAERAFTIARGLHHSAVSICKHFLCVFVTHSQEILLKDSNAIV